MYLQTLLEHHKNPRLLRDKLHQHFFKPYENVGALTQGFFYPLEAIFEETLPNLVLSLYFTGQALTSTFATLGLFLLGNKKETIERKNHTLNALLLSTLTLVTAILGPLLEAMRFFTRWSASLKINLSIKEDMKQLSKPTLDITSHTSKQV